MPPTIVTCPSLALAAFVTRSADRTSIMRAVVVVGAILAASISSASSEDFTCDQWLSARATDPSQDNKALKPLIAFIQGYIAALNQVSDGLNSILKSPVRPTEVDDVLSGIDDGCRRNRKASGPASIGDAAESRYYGPPASGNEGHSGTPPLKIG